MRVAWEKLIIIILNDLPRHELFPFPPNYPLSSKTFNCTPPPPSNAVNHYLFSTWDVPKSCMRIKHSDLRGPPYSFHNRRPWECLNARLSEVCYENKALENVRKCTLPHPPACTHAPHFTWKSRGTKFQSSSLERSKVPRTRQRGSPQNSTREATVKASPSFHSATLTFGGSSARVASASQGSRVTLLSRGPAWYVMKSPSETANHALEAQAGPAAPQAGVLSPRKQNWPRSEPKV